MHISKIFKSHSIAYSFELFPPKSQEAAEQLFATISDLSPLELAFIEMLDGNFNMLMNYKMDGTTPEETNSSNQGGE